MHVALRMKEEQGCPYPALCQKKQAEKMMSSKECGMGYTVFSCQRNILLAIVIPSIDKPITCHKTPRLSVPSSTFDFSPSTTVYTLSRHMSESHYFCPRSLLPYSNDTHDRVPRSWNESPFGKFFSKNVLLALQSLQEPVLSPSSSSFSLDEMS